MGVPAVPLSELYGQRPRTSGARRQGASARRGRFDPRRSDGVQALRRRRRGSSDYAVLATPFNGIEKLLPPNAARWTRCASTRASSNRRRSPAFISGSIARSPRWSTPSCSSAPSSGCSTNRKSWRRERYSAEGQLSRTGGQLVEDAGGQTAAGDHRSGGARTGGVLPGRARGEADEGDSGEGSARDVLSRAGQRCLSSVACTRWPRLFLAGDWTATGWPATMEGAVRSGYGAAEALSGSRFLIPGLPAKGLMRLFSKSG